MTFINVTIKGVYFTRCTFSGWSLKDNIQESVIMKEVDLKHINIQKADGNQFIEAICS